MFFGLEALAVVGLLTFKDCRKWTLIGIIFTIPVLLSIWPYYIPTAEAPFEKHHSQPILRVLNLNVLKENHEYNRVIELFKRENPDIIALQEPNA
jgi:hypothetical protein